MEYATLTRVNSDDLCDTIDAYVSTGWVAHTLLHIPGTAIYTILFERQA